ncbi:methionyl-tRNA formyltransferase [Striga asiatica]|uniref:Methionyl-tRNA formyltransferase n=1 Tax=Striga asiatica TaxID=4170 RepID=A0A5A7PVM3_STRAF|nr:methionyl-tRNA formyltransferase [Striga asiatica]
MAGREVREYLTDPKDKKLGKGKDRVDDEEITFQRMLPRELGFSHWVLDMCRCKRCISGTRHSVSSQLHGNFPILDIGCRILLFLELGFLDENSLIVISRCNIQAMLGPSNTINGAEMTIAGGERVSVEVREALGDVGRGQSQQQILDRTASCSGVEMKGIEFKSFLSSLRLLLPPPTTSAAHASRPAILEAPT